MRILFFGDFPGDHATQTPNTLRAMADLRRPLPAPPYGPLRTRAAGFFWGGGGGHQMDKD